MSGEKIEIDRMVFDAVKEMAPVTRVALRKALKPLTAEQVDGGLSRNIGRGWLVSVPKASIEPNGPAGKRYMPSNVKAPPPLPTYEPRYFTAPFRAATDEGPDGFPPRFNWDGPRKLNEPLPIAKLQTILRRELDSASGKGWGGGTSVMPGTPMQARPSFMGRIPGAAA